MSYIVAFVSYRESAEEYPVQCFRDDLRIGDTVIIRRSDGILARAKINMLRYLNWECNGQIECKEVESNIDSHGVINLPKGSPLSFGILTPADFITALREIGWVQIKANQRMFRGALANVNSSQISYIFVRKNGIDLQVIESEKPEKPKFFSPYEHSWNDGRFVRHAMAHTTFNLYEGMLRFSQSFLNNEENLDRYFVSQGDSDRRTENLKEQSKQRKKEAERAKANREYEDVGDIGDYPDDMYMGYHMR